MSNRLSLTVLAVLALSAAPAFATGDAAKGEQQFKKCKSCHMVVSPEGDVLFKGGKVGPNLYGVIGRAAGSVEGFKYGKDLAAAGEGGLIWDEENIVAYMADPKKFLEETLGKKAKSKMTFRLKKNGEDVAAYLASVSPAPAE